MPTRGPASEANALVDDLLLRKIAYMYYEDNLSQEEIADYMKQNAILPKTEQLQKAFGGKLKIADYSSPFNVGKPRLL